MTPLCVSPYCGLPGRHRDDCDGLDGTGRHHLGGECDGCLPARADDGSYLCRLCTIRLAHDAWVAAWRHEALGRALVMRGRPGEYTSGASKTPGLDLNPAAIQARDDIRNTLVAMVRLIVEERAITPPWRWTIQDLPRDFIGPRNRVRVADDTMPGYAHYIRVHATWLAAHRAADEHARDLRDIATDPLAGRLAFPSAADRLYIGQCHHCGARLHQLPDQPTITCPGCGTTETMEWWQRAIVGTVGGIVDIATAASYLAARWQLVVEARDLRDWVRRGRVSPLTKPDPADPRTEAGDPDDPPRRVPVRDERGRTLFELADLMSYARSIWGPPVSERARRRRVAA